MNYDLSTALTMKLMKIAEAGVAKKSDPGKWEAAKREAKAKMGGKHSARAMQLATQIYKKNGGGYKGKEPSSKNNKLKKWTKQDWGWSGEQKKESSFAPEFVLSMVHRAKLASKGVYLPRRAISALKSTESGKQKLRAAAAEKTRATNQGEQFSRHGLHEGKNRSKLGEDLTMGVPDEQPSTTYDSSSTTPSRNFTGATPVPVSVQPSPSKRPTSSLGGSPDTLYGGDTPSTGWVGSLDRGIQAYGKMNPQDESGGGVFTGDGPGRRALMAATRRRQNIYGENDVMLGFKSQKDMDSWYAELAAAVRRAYGDISRHRNQQELLSAATLATSPIPAARAAGIAYSAAQNLSEARRMQNRVDKVKSQLPPDVQGRISMPSASGVSRDIYDSNTSAAVQDAGRAASGVLSAAGLLLGRNPLGMAGTVLSNLAGGLNTRLDTTLYGDDQQAYYDYLAGRSRGQQLIDSTLKETISANRELAQDPRVIETVVREFSPPKYQESTDNKDFLEIMQETAQRAAAARNDTAARFPRAYSSTVGQWR